MAEKKVYHVSKRKEDGKWQIVANGATRATRVCATKDEAVKAATELAQKAGGTVLIHNTKGEKAGKIGEAIDCAPKKTTTTTAKKTATTTKSTTTKSTTATKKPTTTASKVEPETKVETPAPEPEPEPTPAPAPKTKKELKAEKKAAKKAKKAAKKAAK